MHTHQLYGFDDAEIDEKTKFYEKLKEICKGISKKCVNVGHIKSQVWKDKTVVSSNKQWTINGE